MHHRSAFALSDMLTAMALCTLVLFYSYTMIGCGDTGAGKDGKAANEGAAAKDGAKATVTTTIEEDLKKVKEDNKKLLTEVTSARQHARRMQNGTHVRGIQMGMVLYAQGNRDFYPGLNADGSKATKTVAAIPDQMYGYATADGSHVAYRFAVLLRGNFFSPEYMVSPAETNKGIAVAEVGKNFADGAAYSYALLNISDLKQPRVGEWRATNNSRAAVVSDRNIGGEPSGKGAQSIHTNIGEGWRGSVGYNDNHVNFENTDVLINKFAGPEEIAADKLFSEMEKTERGKSGADAAMVFKAGDAYVNQQP